MIDINLLPPANLLTQKERALRSQLTRVMILLTVIIFAVSAGIFGLGYYFDSQLSTQTQKRDQLLTQFSEFSQVAKDLRTLKDKVAGILIIQGTRTDFATISASLRDTVTGTNLKNFSADSDGHIRFSASTDTMEGLDNFVNKISSGTNNPFSKIAMSNLRRELEGGYSYVIDTQYLFSKPR